MGNSKKTRPRVTKTTIGLCIVTQLWYPDPFYSASTYVEYFNESRFNLSQDQILVKRIFKFGWVDKETEIGFNIVFGYDTVVFSFIAEVPLALNGKLELDLMTEQFIKIFEAYFRAEKYVLSDICKSGDFSFRRRRCVIELEPVSRHLENPEDQKETASSIYEIIREVSNSQSVFSNETGYLKGPEIETHFSQILGNGLFTPNLKKRLIFPVFEEILISYERLVFFVYHTAAWNILTPGVLNGIEWVRLWTVANLVLKDLLEEYELIQQEIQTLNEEIRRCQNRRIPRAPNRFYQKYLRTLSSADVFDYQFSDFYELNIKLRESLGQIHIEDQWGIMKQIDSNLLLRFRAYLMRLGMDITVEGMVDWKALGASYDLRPIMKDIELNWQIINNRTNNMVRNVELSLIGAVSISFIILAILLLFSGLDPIVLTELFANLIQIILLGVALILLIVGFLSRK